MKRATFQNEAFVGDSGGPAKEEQFPESLEGVQKPGTAYRHILRNLIIANIVGIWKWDKTQMQFSRIAIVAQKWKGEQNLPSTVAHTEIKRRFFNFLSQEKKMEQPMAFLQNSKLLA